MPLNTLANKASPSIGFRLTEPEHQAKLAARARAAGVSVHECARKIVIAGLASKVEPQVDGVVQLRRDLAVVLEAMLIAGRILTPPEARQLVHEKLQL